MSPTSTSPKSHPLSHVDEYLAIGQSAGASDIHLGVNAPPLWRLHGTLQPIWTDAPRLTSDQTLALAEGFLSSLHKTHLNERGDADFAYANAFGRYRTSVARQRLGIDLARHHRCRDRPFGIGNAPHRQRFTHARSIARRLSSRSTGTSPDHGERIAPRRHQSAANPAGGWARTRPGFGNTDQHAGCRQRHPRSEDIHAPGNYSDRKKTRHAADGRRSDRASKPWSDHRR